MKEKKLDSPQTHAHTRINGKIDSQTKNGCIRRAREKIRLQIIWLCTVRKSTCTPRRLPYRNIKYVRNNQIAAGEEESHKKILCFENLFESFSFWFNLNWMKWNWFDLLFFLPLTILCHHINLEICAHKHDSRCPFSIFLPQIYVEKCATQNQFRFLPILPRCAGCVCAPECQCHHHIPMKFYTDKHDMTWHDNNNQNDGKRREKSNKTSPNKGQNKKTK